MGERMYYILKILMENNKQAISAQAIKDILEDEYDICIDIKTVYRTLKSINDFFSLVFNKEFISKSKKIGYYLNEDFFSDGQLQLLLDSITYHQDLRSEDKDVLKSKLLKLSSYHQQSRLIHSINSQRELSFSLFVNLNTIMKAIEEKKNICFEYINYKYENHRFKEVSLNNDYMISPYQIILNNNHYYVLGYYKPRKDELSIYRIDRMRYIKTNKSTFIDIREQFNMEEKINHMMNMFVNNETIDLVIEFHQSILREVISRFSIDIEVEPKQLGWYQATIYNIEMSDGLIGWLMMLSDKIRVISPYVLKEEIKKKMRNMAELYHM